MCVFLSEVFSNCRYKIVFKLLIMNAQFQIINTLENFSRAPSQGQLTKRV